MSWSGYVALGTYTSSVFTESTATGYARVALTFTGPLRGRVQAFGANITFTATSAVVTSYNAYAFFTASSGGDPVLVYPLLNTFSYGTAVNYILNPYGISFDLIDGQTTEGLTLDPGGMNQIAGVQQIIADFSCSGAITAHAGGGQGSAVLLTNTVNNVSTVATAGDSVKLPVANAGAVCVINNTGAAALAVFPSTGDTINGGAANASVTMMPNAVDEFWCPANGVWVAEVGSGYSGNFYTEQAQDTITAHAGGGQTSAVLITGQTARVSTVATAGDSVKLPVSAAGLEVVLINSGANPMGVFGSGTDTIDGVATATGVTQMVNSMCIYSCVTAGAWFSDGLGTGYSSSLPTASYTNALTAHAGGGQGSATPLTTVLNRVTTVASSGDSVLLPVSAGGLQITVTNATATNPMNVFPQSGDAINALSVNTAFSVAVGKTASFFCTVAGQWHSILSA
jgi:hypothetical protein